VKANRTTEMIVTFYIFELTFQTSFFKSTIPDED